MIVFTCVACDKVSPYSLNFALGHTNSVEELICGDCQAQSILLETNLPRTGYDTVSRSLPGAWPESEGLFASNLRLSWLLQTTRKGRLSVKPQRLTQAQLPAIRQ